MKLQSKAGSNLSPEFMAAKSRTFARQKPVLRITLKTNRKATDCQKVSPTEPPKSRKNEAPGSHEMSIPTKPDNS
jgi:hypothetical protein